MATAAGFRALLVRRGGLGVRVTEDVVAAVAVAAGGRRLGESRDEQGLGVHAGEIALHHFFVTDAAVAHLVQRGHRRSRVVAAHDRVDAAVATLAGRGLAALDLGVDAVLERRDLFFVAFHAHVEGHRPERLALALVLHGQGGRMALHAIDPLVGRGSELRFVHRDRFTGLVLHLGVVVAAEALRIRDRRLGGGRVGRAGLRCRSGFLRRGGQRSCQGEQQREHGQRAGRNEAANPEHLWTPSEGGAGDDLSFAHASCTAKSGTCEFHLKRPRRGCTHLPKLRILARRRRRPGAIAQRPGGSRSGGSGGACGTAAAAASLPLSRSSLDGAGRPCYPCRPARRAAPGAQLSRQIQPRRARHQRPHGIDRGNGDDRRPRAVSGACGCAPQPSNTLATR